jgi:predicted RecB family nuclease
MSTLNKSVTDSTFDAFLVCPKKARLLCQGANGTESEYAKLSQELDSAYRTSARLQMPGNSGTATVDGRLGYQAIDDLVQGHDLLVDLSVRAGRLHSLIDAAIKVQGESRLGDFHYEPLLFWRNARFAKRQKSKLAYQALVLGEVQGAFPDCGHVVYGPTYAKSKVRLASHLERVKPLVDSLLHQCEREASSSVCLTRHCDSCEFASRCRKEAEDADHLSLLRGISEKEIARHNGNGIFTVNQLSFTFRARRPPKRSDPSPPPHNYALQALSLREHKVYVHGAPELPSATTQIYLDIEGDPARSFYYLIGALIVETGRTRFYSFWAKEHADQAGIVERFLRRVDDYSDYIIYHFGKYDADALKEMRQLLPAYHIDKLDRCIDRAVNLVPIIHHHVYFPVYANGLKNIATALGFRWTCSDPNSLQSIVWRHRWEASTEGIWQELIQDYNRDDCRALQVVVEFIQRATGGGAMSPHERPQISPPVVQTSEMMKVLPFPQQFARVDFEIPEWNAINECAYFDYQRDRVYVRTNEDVRKARRCKSQKAQPSRRIDKTVEIDTGSCPKCGGSERRAKGRVSKVVIDLKVSKKGGIKRWVVRYRARRNQCARCGSVFLPDEYAAIPPKYGHSLTSWCVYQHVVRRQDMQHVGRSLNDVFGITIPSCRLYRFKMSVADRLRDRHRKLLDHLVGGSLMHIDETPVMTTRGKGYVWVFVSMDKVYYLYRPSREADFLTALLDGFNGVVVSDFYSGYDSLECEKQRCIIHLMRDMNADLRKHPFDQELRAIVRPFSTLLREIVQTIDRFGLKKYHLRKYQRQAHKFVKSVGDERFSSVPALKYQQRIEKYGFEMYTFLNHDGVPWNNNNAEHAIKHFAKARTFHDGRWTEKSLDEYLVMLSAFQSCELRGGNAWNLLLSAESEGAFMPPTT